MLSPVRKLALAVSAAALLAVPAAPAPAAEIPEINCGIVSCTYQIERKIDEAREQTGPIVDCVVGTVHAIENAIAGYPQPYAC